MIKKFYLFFLLLILLLWVQLAWSGTTGKIAGTVIDRETKEPLPGANIRVEGTMLGAASDDQGHYTIINVPPGTYTVTASYIGYSTINSSQVRVWMDQSTIVDFQMSMEVIPGEVITVVAERKVIKPDVSTSVASVASSELVSLPVSNVTDIVGLQAGVRGLDIRGSTASNALFMVDGITMRDPRNNEPISTIPLNAIEAISVERGGFNAEYGQVQSGIVNVVTREGRRDKYQVSAEFKYSPPKPKYFGISPYDANSFWFRPYLDDAVCWTGTESINPETGQPYWDKYTQRQYPKFEGWNAISRARMTDNIPGNDLSPAGAQQVFLWEHRRKPVTDQPDYDVDMGLGGPIPVIGKSLGDLRFFSSYRRHREMLLIPLTRDDYVDDDLMVQLISDLTPSMKLRFTTMRGNRYTMVDNWVYGWEVRSPDRIVNRTAGWYGEGIFNTGWFSLSDVKYQSFAGKFTHLLSPKTYYEVSLEHLARSYFTRPPAPYDTTKKHEIIPGYFVDDAPFGYNSELGAKGINSMGMGGHSCRYRDDSRVSATTLKADFTSQVTAQHLLKTGLEVVYNELNLDYMTAGVNIQDTTRRNDYPIRAAWYIQDKMEAKGFIVNAGLRFDYSNSNTRWYDVDPFYRPFFSTKYDPSADYPTKRTKGQWQLSPRLGISHPVTENSKLFFNYGHFKQMPSYETLFRMTRTQTRQLSQIGDPNLILAKTISYELGYDHSLFKNQLLIQVAAFYKDISDQQRTVTYYGIKDVSYSKTTSNGYADIRGFELTLKKPLGRWWNGFANYTYQSTKTGHFGRDEVYQDPSQQAKYDRATSNLYQDRPIPQPYARVNLAFFTPPDFGPRWGLVNPLSDWLLNVLFDWQKGGYITWNPKNVEAIQFNVATVDWYNMTLRLSKKSTIRPFDIYLFTDVTNALNTKFLSLWGTINSFSDYQDQIYYMESLHLPKNPAYDNIPGNDKYADYPQHGHPYQSIEQRGQSNLQS
ncbi:MAG: TonB-dependent receptor, partial [candidate division KSB1 bacterium]|nr:TonB-dependent receptor [candidate division KSB1 bacterium]